MYRIRRESGDEIALGSIDEFAAAVAAGTITAKAEIYHARAERWLPIASHPHFKMAQDRISNPAASRAPRAVTASGQRPAITGSAPAAPSAPVPPAPRPQQPQLRVVRTESPAATAVAPKAAPRWTAPQRSAATATAPKPSVAPAPAPEPEPTELRLVQADAIVSPPEPVAEMEFELLPVEAAPVPEPVAPAPELVAQAPEAAPAPELVAPEAPVAEAVMPEPVVAAAPVAETETVVERTPPEVQLVSHEDKPAAERAEVEFIHPDRSMPVITKHELPQLEIPAPIQDFATTEAPAPAPRSRAPLFIGIGVAAAAAAAIAFFALKPSPAAPTTVAATPVSQAPAPSVAPSAAPTPVAATPAPATPTGSSAGLGGDAPRKKRSSDDATAKTDGLEPPPEEVIPAAPKLGGVGDAAALPTVDAQSAGSLDHAKALEKTRREIDSSMRQ